MSALRNLFISLAILLIAFGCSQGGSSPVTSDMPAESSLDSIPIIAYDGTSATGMFGAYNLSISPDIAQAELTPMRVSQLGESYIVSGASFFTNKQCLKIKSIAVDEGARMHIVFQIRHPFEKGSTSEPPSWINRLDLDLFDVALVIVPKGSSSTSYNLVNAYSNVMLNPDGYTTDLTSVINDPAALPYRICYENQNNNRFEMGTEWQEFDVLLALGEGEQLNFDLYATMGYGWSAVKRDRLYPTYYIPEFNRKSAWKVEVHSPTWKEGDTLSALPVTIDVFDWNHGATIAGDYPDINNTDHISAESDILSVHVEIPDLLVSPVGATTSDTSHDGFENPISFTANIANEKGALEGAYLGIIRVVDSREPSNIPETADSLIHSPDSIQFEYYLMPEFATYQTFIAKVAKVAPGYGWGGDFGSDGSDVGRDLATDSEGNIYVTGYFHGTVDFDPNEGEVWCTSNGEADVFLTKLDESGNHVWVKTWGSGIWDEGHGLAIDANDNIYVVGNYRDSMDLNPDAGQDIITSNGELDAFLSRFTSDGTYLWGLGWGGLGVDSAHGVTVIESFYTDTVYVTGFFAGSVDFNPWSSIDSRTSNGLKDAYLVRFNTDYSYQGVGTWGGNRDDRGYDITSDGSNDVYVTGFYNAIVDFDPDPVDSVFYSSNGDRDIFVTKFNYDGDHQWTNAWGGAGADIGYSLTHDYYDELFITGCFTSIVDFDPGSSVDNHTSLGGQDIFLSKIYGNGNFVWARTWGGLGIWDEGHGVAVADGGKILVTGGFEEDVDFDPGGTDATRSSNGGSDIFLSQFDDDGAFRWVYTWGGVGIWDEGHGVAAGSVYVTGQFAEYIDFDPTPGEEWHVSSGSSDIFLIKLKAEGIDESEPNDTCEDADEIFFDDSLFEIYVGTAYGAVRESVDDVDYWWFHTWGAVVLNVDIYLYNDSGYDVDLYLYDDDCFSETVPPSTNSGGSDESLLNIPGISGDTTYFIKVPNVPDGYSAQKDYHLVVEITYSL